MTESDAKEYVTQNAADWTMPEEWWELSCRDGLTMHVDGKVAEAILDGRVERKDGRYFFLDLYGAETYLEPNAIISIFHSTRLVRAKWIVGLPERNWKADEKEDWEH